MDRPIILFDGVCNLCDSAVLFIIKHDKKELFMFASLQSIAGQKLLQQYNLPADELNSFIFIYKGKAFSRSTGALKVVKKLNGLLPILYSFIVLPEFFRDSIYKWVAKNRYKWFGKKDTCLIPITELKARFLS